MSPLPTFFPLPRAQKFLPMKPSSSGGALRTKMRVIRTTLSNNIITLRYSIVNSTHTYTQIQGMWGKNIIYYVCAQWMISISWLRVSTAHALHSASPPPTHHHLLEPPCTMSMNTAFRQAPFHSSQMNIHIECGLCLFSAWLILMSFAVHKNCQLEKRMCIKVSNVGSFLEFEFR